MNNRTYIEKLIKSHITRMEHQLARRDKNEAVYDWLTFPNHSFADRIMNGHLAKLTNEEHKRIEKNVAVQHKFGIPFDECNDLRSTILPARIIGRECSYQRIRRFIRYVSQHSSKLAKKLNYHIKTSTLVAPPVEAPSLLDDEADSDKPAVSDSSMPF